MTGDACRAGKRLHLVGVVSEQGGAVRTKGVGGYARDATNITGVTMFRRPLCKVAD